MPRLLQSALLVLGIFLLFTASAAAQDEVDFDTCMAACGTHFKKVVDTDGGCPEVLKNIRNDLGLIREQLTHPRLCTGKHRMACKEWAEASMDALDKLRALLKDVEDCRQVNVSGIKPLLWPLTPAKACRGDGAYTDLHDYMSGNQKMVTTVTDSGAIYSFQNLPIPMGDDLWGQAPYCDPPLKPHRKFVSPLLEFYLTLTSLEPWQACTMQCKEPTPALRRIFKARDALAAVEKTYEEVQAARFHRGQARTDAFEARGMTAHPCRAFAALDVQCERLDSDLAAARETIATLLSQEAPDTEAILNIERLIEGLDVQISSLDVDALAEECDAEDHLAIQFEKRRRALIDQLQRAEEVSLEAWETFARLGGPGEPCEYHLDCNLPMLCRGQGDKKCASKVSMEQILDLMERSKILEAEAFAYEVYDADGLREDAGPSLDALDARLKGLRRQLLDLGWEDAVAGWREAFRASVDEKVDALTEGAVAALAAHKDIPREDLLDPMACRRSIRDLEGLVSDLRSAREVLGNEDPVTNPRWVSVQLSKLTKASNALDEAQAACDEHCIAAEPETDWMVYSAAAAGVILILVVLGFVVFRKRLLTGR